MIPRPASVALASVVLLAACDAGMTGPGYDHLASLSLSPGFACGLDAGGRAYCWGDANGTGQLGNGTNRPSQAPIRVQGGARFRQVVTGGAHACGLASDGRAYCWGDNSLSQIGVRTTDLDCNLLQPNGWVQDFANACAVVPAPVQTELRFVELGAGGDRTCGRTSGGEIWCWGASYFGLGDSARTSESDSLIRVAAPVRFSNLAIGAAHACASDADGQGWCWGYNGYGELGRGALDSVNSLGPVPKPINSSAYIRQWALGQVHTCALTGGGDALCWGAGAAGQRGDSTFVAVRHDPVFVATALKFSQVAAAGDATCALEAGSGAAWCWGGNAGGQLGDGTVVDRVAPAPVLGGLTFSRIVMGSPDGSAVTACAASGGRFYCWGPLPQPLTFGE